MRFSNICERKVGRKGEKEKRKKGRIKGWKEERRVEENNPIA